VEEVQGGGDDEAEPEPVPSFTEALHGFESMRAFMYAHDIASTNYATACPDTSMNDSKRRTRNYTKMN
jgi:hypothetical protein